MGRVLSLILAAALTIGAQAQQPFGNRTPPQGQLDDSEAMFTVMAAINAAGFDQDADSPTNNPLRQQVRSYLKGLNLKSVPPLEQFLREHRPDNRAKELTQYVSFALTINGPPDFSYHYPVDSLPPDVTDLHGLTPLLVAFYREAHLGDLWTKVQPAYDQVLAEYQAPIARAVLVANAYLRNDTAGYLGKRFQIYIDLLGPPNQVQIRNYADDFYVVVTPAADIPISEIRHAYLLYLVDPLTTKFAAVVKTKHAVGDYALGSPILDAQFKNDFQLLTTECLIRAIESRIDHNPALVNEALREGFVLTPALAEQLAGYEQQESAMRLYFPDLIKGIDMAREEKRLDHIDFYETPPALRAHEVTRQEKPPEATGVAKTLDDAENAYLSRDLARAKDGYLQVLKQTAEPPLHAKAYYGLARIAVLERDPELGDRLFRKVLELQPDPATKSWSLLYLGRLADSQGDREHAKENYQAALAVEGAPDTVRKAAEKGLKEAFTKK
ncbi:MAG TPA: hypothetical protein VMB85_12015 [Bryobacteraceae bacterium]|nr:hypothetical protein [Bryobacteraceae bacterium]